MELVRLVTNQDPNLLKIKAKLTMHRQVSNHFSLQMLNRKLTIKCNNKTIRYSRLEQIPLSLMSPKYPTSYNKFSKIIRILSLPLLRMKSKNWKRMRICESTMIAIKAMGMKIRLLRLLKKHLQLEMSRIGLKTDFKGLKLFVKILESMKT